MSAEGVPYPCILRSVTWPAVKQACTAPEPVGSGEAADPAAKEWLINTPSTICPTPRTPNGLQPLTSLELPPAWDIPEQTLSSGDVQPFWWYMPEGDEGVLGTPFDEPLAGRQGLTGALAALHSFAVFCLGLKGCSEKSEVLAARDLQLRRLLDLSACLTGSLTAALRKGMTSAHLHGPDAPWLLFTKAVFYITL